MISTHLLGVSGWLADNGLPLTDRGFRYGMSIFETIAIRDGRPLLLEEHLARLAETLETVEFRLPTNWLEAVQTFLKAPPIREGVARIYVTAGDDDGAESRVALLLEEMPISTVVSTARAGTMEFVQAVPFGKTGNYWPHILARGRASGEAILCAPDGQLLSGAMANLFLLKGDRLITPRRPVRRGVIRDWVLAKAREEFPSTQFEADLTQSDLEDCDAAFLTNSRIGICRLEAIDARELSEHPFIGALWERYRQEVLNVR
jgi:branched-subunit amino acid aminotransferase/4-amino-4-deoxychorismate lyase